MKLSISYTVTVQSEVEVDVPNHLRMSGLGKLIQGEAEAHAYKTFFPNVVAHAEVRVDNIKIGIDKVPPEETFADVRAQLESRASRAMAREDRVAEEPRDLGSGL